MGISKKKKMKSDDDQPYVPPMGDLSKAGSSSGGSVYKWRQNVDLFWNNVFVCFYIINKGGGGIFSDSAHDIPAILFWVLIT